MRRTLWESRRAVAVVAACLLIATRFVSGAEAEKSLPAAEILPEGTVMYVECAEWSEWAQGFSQTSLAKIFAEPEVKTFLSGPIKELSDLLKKATSGAKPAEAGKAPAPAAPAAAPETGGGVELADFVPSGPVTFAVRYSAEDAAAKRAPAWVVVIGDHQLNTIEPTKQLILTVLDALLKGKDFEKTVQVMDYQNSKLLTLKRAGPGGTPVVIAALATFKDRVILANELEITQQVMDGLAGTLAKKLANNATYKTCGLSGTENMSAYVDIAGMQTAAGVKPKSAAVAASAYEDLFALAGVGQTGSVAWSMKMAGPAFESRTAIVAKGERGGLLATLDEQPLSADTLKIIPPTAPFATAFRLRHDHVMDFIRGAARTAATQKAFEDFQAIAKELNLEKAVPAAFGDEVVFASSPNVDTGSAFGATVFVASLAVKDQQKADELVSQVLTRVAAKMDPKGVAANVLKEVEFEGVKLRYFTPSQLAGALGFAPAFGVLPDRMIVAFDVPTLKSAMRTLKGESLAQTKRFTDAFAALNGKSGALFVYVDWAASYKAAFNASATVLRLVAPADFLRAAGIDLNLLPSTEAVTQHLFPGMSVAQITPNGVVLTSRSPLPSLEVLVPPMAAFTTLYDAFSPEVKKK